MPDADDPLRVALQDKLADLVRQHEDLILDLYKAVAAEHGETPWESMNKAEKAKVLEEAREYCEAIENDPIAWAMAQVEPRDAVSRAVAAQYDIIQRMQNIEEESRP